MDKLDNNIVFVEYVDGKKEHYQDGLLHRVNGPAVEYANGMQVWYRHGEMHRSDGPAVIRPDSEEWWSNGLMHRVDGPAYIGHGGKVVNKRCWYSNGELHRADGPAVYEVDEFGRELTYEESKLCRWYINGKPTCPPG